MRWMTCLLISVCLSSSLFGADSTGASDEINEFFSFENDMEGWTANGTDLEIGDGFIDWSIMRSQEMARDGKTSLRFYLQNNNDNGKIWIERPFNVEPHQLYHGSVEYEVATRDSGVCFELIAGVLKQQPKIGDDLIPAYQDDACTGKNKNVGYKWLSKKYEFTLRTQEEQMVYAVVGIAGNFEVGKIYYFDNVRVTLTKKPVGSEFYSFEDDLDGWTVNGPDLESSGGPLDLSITRTQEIWEDGRTSLKFDLDSLNGKGKIWIEKPFVVEPKQIYKVGVDYSFRSLLRSGGASRIITGVFRAHPENEDDLAAVYQEKADNEGFNAWLRKSYQFKVKSKKSTVLYVVIGIREADQALHTYWFDSVCITLTKK